MVSNKIQDPPRIIGILGDEEIPTKMQSSISRELSAQGLNYISLPLQVEGRYLHNLIECMKLMDIIGLVIVGSHQKSLMKILAPDKSAKDAGKINLVKREGKRFVGYFLDEGKRFCKETVALLRK